ncbi:MAG: Mut7-C RNAse domain-containing protein [Dehalococcoidia bacterium]
MKPGFVADVNVGRLARRLRMLGYDTLFINGADDDELIRIALREGRILLTRDTGITTRRVVTTGKIKALLVESDDVTDQLWQVVKALNLGPESEPFSICIECNVPLIPKEKDEVRDLVPPHVFKTHSQFVQCPQCKRVFWRGTHWEKMMREMEALKG